jgi:hypothetical protein
LNRQGAEAAKKNKSMLEPPRRQGRQEEQINI